MRRDVIPSPPGSQIIESSAAKGTYSVRVDYGLDANGKRSRGYETVRGLRNAQRLARQRLSERDKGLIAGPTRVSVYALVQEWLRSNRKATKKSLSGYAELIDLYLKNTDLGNAQARKVTDTQVEAWVTELEEEKKLSPATIRQVFTFVRAGFRLARDRGKVARDPTATVTPPTIEKRPPTVLTPEEFKRLLLCVDRPVVRLLFDFSGQSGMRPGEVANLRWSEVDLDARTATVLKGKTEAAARTVRLPAGLCGKLAQHREALASLSVRSVFVFPNEKGKPFNRSNLANRHLKPALERAGLPKHFRLHDFRHVCASLLARAGVHPKVVQERLGHSKVSVTLDVYSHLFDDMQQEAAETLDQLLG
jgi:integrase